jgi:hypothetical protein
MSRRFFARAFRLAVVMLAGAVMLGAWRLSLAQPSGKPAPQSAAAPKSAAATGTAAAAAQPAAPAVAAAPVGNMVRITFITVPAKPATVSWGRKRLGVIGPHQPLVVTRPRDSGPLDVVIRSAGYLNVQTRAYTFADSKIAVKLTPPDQKKTLLGYREAPPPEPDAGAAPAAPQAPAGPVANGATPDGGVVR